MDKQLRVSLREEAFSEVLVTYDPQKIKYSNVFRVFLFLDRLFQDD